MGGEGRLILADEQVQQVGERLFGLRSEILVGPWPGPRKGLCPSGHCGGSPMLEGVKSAAIAGVGVAIYEDGQLKVGGHF